MATEYYMVKPSRKEMYGLGKRLNYFSYINVECYGSDPDHADYECFHDFMIDVIDNNGQFMEQVADETWSTIVDLLYEIYEFISEDKVFMINDCSDDFSKVCEGCKEVGSIYDFFERRYCDEGE